MTEIRDWYVALYRWDAEDRTWVVELEGQDLVTYGGTLRAANHNIREAARSLLGRPVEIHDVLVHR